jgi:hypothetical protein
MSEPCKHGHVDGVMHRPCPRCEVEYLRSKVAELEAENAALGRVPLTESQANRMYARLKAAEAKVEAARLCCRYGPASMDALKAANSVVIRADELQALLNRPVSTPPEPPV